MRAYNHLAMTIPKPRAVFAAIFVACAGLIAFALYLQHAQGLEPCPMCILQRYAFVAIGAIALIAALHGPGLLVSRIYAGLVSLFAVAGGGIAIRHSWLQHFPPKIQSCGADLDYLLGTFPLAKALPAIFQGTGECEKVEWRFLWLSIPEWALVWFVIFGVFAIVAVAKRRSA
jgi:disulfide bond formation protein DsbB